MGGGIQVTNGYGNCKFLLTHTFQAADGNVDPLLDRASPERPVAVAGPRPDPNGFTEATVQLDVLNASPPSIFIVLSTIMYIDHLWFLFFKTVLSLLLHFFNVLLFVFAFVLL